MSTTQPSHILESGGDHLKPFLTAVGIFAATVVLAFAVIALL